jgi:hypothetical protein
MSSFALAALLPTAYLAFVIIFTTIARVRLPFAVHLVWAVGGLAATLATRGISQTWLPALVASILFFTFVWTGILSRTVAFALPTLMALVPADLWFPLYGPAFGLVVLIAGIRLVRHVSKTEIMTTAFLTATQPFSQSGEEANIAASDKTAPQIPVLPLWAIGICFSVITSVIWANIR